MDYVIRAIKESEYPLLNDFIYEAIFIPKGVAVPEKSIISNPDLQVYIAGFGTQKDDCCVVKEVNNKVVGAAWVRIMNDYGHIDDETPSLACVSNMTIHPLKSPKKSSTSSWLTVGSSVTFVTSSVRSSSGADGFVPGSEFMAVSRIHPVINVINRKQKSKSVITCFFF